METIRLLLASLGSTVGWVAVVGACVVGVYVVYIGVALVAALFSRNERDRRHAAQVLQQLLDAGRGDRS